jgi:hypothetical protein
MNGVVGLAGPHGSGRPDRPAPCRVGRPLPLYLLDAPDLALAFAHRWWQHARDGALLPPRAALDTPAFRLLVADAAWIDVAAADVPRAWSAWTDDIAAVRATGAPRLQELRPPDHGRPAPRWRRLMLPCAPDGRRVEDILVLLRPTPDLSPDDA